MNLNINIQRNGFTCHKNKVFFVSPIFDTDISYILQFSSVHSCVLLCDPMDCSTPGLCVHYQLTEFTQTLVHWVGDAIQPSHPLHPLISLLYVLKNKIYFPNIWDYLKIDKEGWYGSGWSSIKQTVTEQYDTRHLSWCACVSTITWPLSPWVIVSYALRWTHCPIYTLAVIAVAVVV